MASSDTFSLIDSHAHIQTREFAADVAEVIQHAQSAGVKKIIAVGGAGDLSSNRAALDLAEAFPTVFATVGMHPHDAKNIREEDFEALSDLALKSRVVAVGETGLDLYYEHSPRTVQFQIFSRFIHMARAINLPLIVHDRDAHREVAELLRSEGSGMVRGVIHCFTGDYEAAKTFLDLGFYLSFSGIITFKNAEPLRRVVRQLPLDRMMVETDSPYLAPVPHRGERNEPTFVCFVAEAVAKVRGVSLEEVARVTSQNAEALFGI